MEAFMEKVESELLRHKPREKSGSSSANRFDYQKDWALCKLLQIHTKEIEYILLLEYHDDVVLITKNNDNEEIEFYQIKTKGDTHWTLSSLISNDKKEMSIISKMYDNINKFKKNAKKAVFVSNVYCNLELKSGNEAKDLEKFLLEDLKEDKKNKIVLKIKNELKIDGIDEKKIEFEVSKLHIKDSELGTRGQLSKFLESLGISYYNIDAVYKVLSGELKQRNNYENDITENLFEKKGIRRSQMDKYICEIKSVYSNVITWEMMKEAYEIKGLTEKKNIKSGFEKIKGDILNIDNVYLIELRKKIKNRLETFIDNGIEENLLEKSIEGIKCEVYDKWQLKALSLYELTKLI